MDTHAKESVPAQRGKALSEYFKNRLSQFIAPLKEALDMVLDVRLVRTVEAVVACLVRHRHRQQGMLLSELGEHLADPAHAPAGTKRLSNLLRSPNWDGEEIKEFILGKALLLLPAWRQIGQRPLLMCDDSVVEKPESLAAEGLCAVPSSKSKRLTKIKPGYWKPPLKGTVHVPGFQWFSVVLSSLATAPQLVAMEWWTSRGEHASSGKTERESLFRKMCAHFSDAVHVFDRGFAGAPWPSILFECRAEFILRWNKAYLLCNEKGEKKKVWQMARGKKAMGGKLIWDAVRKKRRSVSILFLPVEHPEFPGTPLTLVVSKPGKGMKPWYLLTNLCVEKLRQAWFVVHAYARRWDIGFAFRFCKSELALESPRLWFWLNRLKFMQLVALTFAFLLSILHSTPQSLRNILLNCWCKRTGKRYRLAAIPLYRIRLALSHLWNFQVSQSSG